MFEFITNIFKIILTPLWWKDYSISENNENEKDKIEIEEITEGTETYQNIKYKDNKDTCIAELETFLNTMNICNKLNNEVDDNIDDIYSEEMNNLIKDVADDVYSKEMNKLIYKELYYDEPIEMGFEND